MAKDWREKKPEYYKADLNMRDLASINEMMVLSNIESMNAKMMRSVIDKKLASED